MAWSRRVGWLAGLAAVLVGAHALAWVGAPPALAQLERCRAGFAPSAGSEVPVANYARDATEGHPMALGDVSGDGRADLAVAGLDLHVLYNYGRGGFLRAGDYRGFSPPRQTIAAAAADVNGDGRMDLALVQASGAVTIMLGTRVNQSPSFALAPGSPFATGNYATDIAVGRFNGDAHLDLVVATAETDPGFTPMVWLGNGDGSFSLAPHPLIPGTAFSVAVGRFNGDGFDDFATTRRGYGVDIFLSTGDGGYTRANTMPLAGGSGAAGAAVGDFNGDGRADLAVADRDAGAAIILLGNGNGTFVPGPGSPVAAGSGARAVAAGDFNTDGVADLAVANEGADTVTILLGTGTGGFTQLRDSPVAVGDGPTALAAGYFDEDRYPDITVLNTRTSTLTVLLNSLSSVDTAGAYAQQYGYGAYLYAYYDYVQYARADAYNAYIYYYYGNQYNEYGNYYWSTGDSASAMYYWYYATLYEYYGYSYAYASYQANPNALAERAYTDGYYAYLYNHNAYAFANYYCG